MKKVLIGAAALLASASFAVAQTLPITLAVSTTITPDVHALAAVINMSGAGAARTFTLPAATGTGFKYKFAVLAVNTSGYVIKVANATDTIDGGVLVQTDDAANAVIGITAAGTDDTITMNGTTTGGVVIGDYVILTDVLTGQWAVEGMITGSGVEATPFSATV